MADDQNLEVEAVEPERPEWLPDNFKSPEDLAKSYKELERSFHSSRQEVTQNAQRLAEVEAQLEEARTQPEPASEDSRAQLEAWYEQNPLEVMQMIAQQAAQQNAQQLMPQFTQQLQAQQETQNALLAQGAEQIITGRLDDWADYREKVAAALSEEPDLLPESALVSPEKTAQALERVYKMVKHDELLADNQKLASDQLRLDRLAKEQAQTLSGQTGRPLPTDSDVEYWKGVENAPVTSYGQLRGGT